MFVFRHSGYTQRKTFSKQIRHFFLFIFIAFFQFFNIKFVSTYIYILQQGWCCGGFMENIYMNIHVRLLLLSILSGTAHEIYIGNWNIYIQQIFLPILLNSFPFFWKNMFEREWNFCDNAPEIRQGEYCKELLERKISSVLLSDSERSG